MNAVETLHNQQYGWKDTWDAYTEQLKNHSPVSSAWNRERRIRLLTGLVEHYSKHQHSSGAIIDPYSEKERYYSTPSYAMAAAVLVQEGRKDLLESAAAALTSSIEALAEHRAPDEHPDFFPVMIMGAYRILQNLLPEQAAYWRDRLQEIEPEETYVFTMSKMKNPNRMINWNAIMLTGEYMRYAEGMADQGTDWMDDYLQKYHVPRFTSLGFYQDGPLNLPNCPFAYDIVTRYHLTIMMMSGYQGAASAQIREQLQRGAVSSLLSLSPLGELPTRGRSSQHQWNEAAAAMIFTAQAVQWKQNGEDALAGAFRHAADLAWEAIERWQNASGDLQIVRNFYSPEQRHGYEIYTNHTCYNLWTAAALAYALDIGEEMESSVPYPIPAEIGSYVLETDGWFQTLFSVVPGQQLVLHTALNDPYNIPGLSRIHRAGMPGLIGPSAAGYRDQGFTRFAEGDIFPLIHGPAWQDDQQHWYQLAEGVACDKPFDCDVGVDPAEGGWMYKIVNAEQRPDGNRVVLEWTGPLAGGIQQIQADYEQTPGKITVKYTLINSGDAKIEQIGAWIPLFISDGMNNSTIEKFTIENSKSNSVSSEQQPMSNQSLDRIDKAVKEIKLSYQQGQLRIRPLTPDAIFTFPSEADRVASRNGLLTGARLESHGKEIAYQIDLIEIADNL